MAMIDATAQESRHARRTDAAAGIAGAGDGGVGHALQAGGTVQHIRRLDIDAVPLVDRRKWRIPRLISCIAAGLIMTAAIGGVILAWHMSQRQPPAVAADSAREGTSRAIGNASTPDEPVEAPAPPAAPDSLAMGAEGKRTAEGGVEAGTTSVPRSDDPVNATPVVEQPIANLGPGAETPDDGAADAPTSTEATWSDPIAPSATATSEQPLAPEPPSSPRPASEAGPTIDRANDPVAIRVARVVSGVRMRAGPSNSQAVLAAIPTGSTVEVIGCRQWCEVIFAGQRGWVYKRFIGKARTERGP